MKINEVISLQKAFDDNHNWSQSRNDVKGIIRMINKDIVGIIGELGEFSNKIKKINLLYDLNKDNKAEEKYTEELENMQEEIVDTFIYLLRIVSHLDIDLENAYLNKLSINKIKYKEFEKND